jgi:hypothetical protein
MMMAETNISSIYEQRTALFAKFSGPITFILRLISSIQNLRSLSSSLIFTISAKHIAVRNYKFPNGKSFP